MELHLIVVGFHSLSDYVLGTIMKFKNDINSIKTISYGSLGNFATLTYGVEVDNQKMFAVRRDILNELSLPGSPVFCTYEHGAMTNIYIFSKTAFKNAPETHP